jgi:hypothetical protein
MITYLELGVTDGVSVSLVSTNVWILAGDTLNITCNFLYCNYQVHRDFLITLYVKGHLGYKQAYQIIRTADLDRKLRTVGGQPAFCSLCLGLLLTAVRDSMKVR